MMPLRIEDWLLYRRNGTQFLNTVRAAHAGQKLAFSAENIMVFQ